MGGAQITAIQSNQLDRINLNILRLLKENARLPHVKLACQVGLSTTRDKELVERPERRVIVRNYQAVLDPITLDTGLVMSVYTGLSRTSQDMFEEFTARVLTLTEVQECCLKPGELGLNKSPSSCLGAYRHLSGETLSRLRGV